jgi:hypothetical protein
MNTDRVSRRGNKYFRTGVYGIAIAAICYPTPVLAVALAPGGLAAIVPKLGYVLLPAPLIFSFLALYGWLKERAGREHPR